MGYGGSKCTRSINRATRHCVVLTGKVLRAGLLKRVVQRMQSVHKHLGGGVLRCVPKVLLGGRQDRGQHFLVQQGGVLAVLAVAVENALHFVPGEWVAVGGGGE